MRMEAICGSAWTARMNTSEKHSILVDEWGSQLYGLTEQELRKGLDSLTSSYPPSPAEFRLLCRPPTTEDIYGIAK